MTFYILLSSAAILTAIVGCALIWGFDVARAREIERTVAQPVPVPAVPAVPAVPVSPVTAAQRHHEVEARRLG